MQPKQSGQDSLDRGFEEYIGPGFCSHGQYDELVWPHSARDSSEGPLGNPRGVADAEQSYVGRGPRNYRRSDDRIAEDVNEALTWHREIDASDVEVAVAFGVVFLRGTVHEHHIQRMVVELALQTPGVLEVHDELCVVPI